MVFSLGFAKQLSLSSTSALISGDLFLFAAARSEETGAVKSSNEDIVACGRHNEGFTKSLTTFKVAETFIEIYGRRVVEVQEVHQ